MYEKAISEKWDQCLNFYDTYPFVSLLKFFTSILWLFISKLESIWFMLPSMIVNTVKFSKVLSYVYFMSVSIYVEFFFRVLCHCFTCETFILRKSLFKLECLIFLKFSSSVSCSRIKSIDVLVYFLYIVSKWTVKMHRTNFF